MTVSLRLAPRRISARHKEYHKRCHVPAHSDQCMAHGMRGFGTRCTLHTLCVHVDTFCLSGVSWCIRPLCCHGSSASCCALPFLWISAFLGAPAVYGSFERPQEADRADSIQCADGIGCCLRCGADGEYEPCCRGGPQQLLQHGAEDRDVCRTTRAACQRR